LNKEMKLFVCLLLLGTVLAYPQSVENAYKAIQKVAQTAQNSFQTQDYTQLSQMCAAGGVSGFFGQFLSQLPPQYAGQFLPAFQGLGACLDPMCGIVNSNCWTDLSTNLPQSNCVPGLTAQVAFLQSMCSNGCFAQLDSVVASSAQCFANWAASFANTFAGAGSGVVLNINLGTAGASTNYLCMQNPGDALFCVTKLASSATLLVNAVDVTDPANCPYFQSLGCCATGLSLLLAVFNGTVATGCGSNVAPFTPAQYQQILVTCNMQNVPACPVIGDVAKIGVVHWVIDHIDFTVFNGLSDTVKLAFLAALRNDFTNSTGLALDVVTVGKIISAATGVDVVFIIRAISDVLTGTNFNDYKNYISGTSMPSFTHTTQFSSSYSGLSTGSVQLNSAASSSSLQSQAGAGPSGASIATVSAAAIIAVAFATLFA